MNHANTNRPRLNDVPPLPVDEVLSLPVLVLGRMTP